VLRAKSISLIAGVMLTAIPALCTSPVWQGRGGSHAPQVRQGAPKTGPAPVPQAGAQQSYTFHPQGPGPHRGDWLRKYMTLPPHQQEQQLRRDPGFQSLSPERQNHLLDRLRNFNSQSPEKKAQILNRMETFEHMSPQQQQQARNLFNQYRNLPDDQKDKVSQAYRRLRGMPPSARSDLLNSDEFKNNYTSEQRDLLKGMTDLNMNPTQAPGPTH
jgi:hypothetical protein